MMAQELAVIPQRSVLENVFLGRRNDGFFVRTNNLRRRYRELCDSIGYAVPADARVGSLSIADQQKVEVLRAVARGARAIVMDEPTAALARPEAEKLFELIHRLRDAGTTIIYVSHFLQDVLEVCERITVLKDGRIVRTTSAVAETPDSLIEGMLGRPLDRIFPEKRPAPDDEPAVLQVFGVAQGSSERELTIEVKRGEIVGVAGLVGAGRSEFAREIFGATHGAPGHVEIDGEQLRHRSPRRAISARLAMIPESRRTQGLLMQRSVLENLSLTYLRDASLWGFIRRRVERRRCSDMVDALQIKTNGLNAPVSSLSGGNQQKVLFGRWLMEPPRVLIADEPTRGVDIGAKQGIYVLLHRLAAEGVGILLISSEVEELVGLAHRVVVMRGGRIVSELPGPMVSETNIVRAAFGSSTEVAEGSTG